jgi:SsrA-binding protein
MSGPQTRRASSKEPTERLIARNRRASFDYELEDTWEAGIVLVGAEVKSLRDGKVEMVDAWATVEGGELWLHGMLIAPYAQATTFAPEPKRKRKLLLHEAEIAKIEGKLKDRGYTLVPLRIYLRGRLVKLEIALARGKTKGDRRQDIARKDAEREARAAMGRARKGGS